MLRRDLGLIIALVLCIVGAVFLVRSPEFGKEVAGTWLREHGGSGSTDTYLHMMETGSAAYRTLGAVMLGGGLYGLFGVIGKRQ